MQDATGPAIETMHTDTPVAGVDGARGGWLAVLVGGAGITAHLLPRAADVIGLAAAQIAVDMPIGLADSGPRACDRAARRLLPKPRRASVFAPPRRYMLGLAYAEANAAGRQREGVGLSRQAWHIGRRVAELDAVLTPAAQARVAESHPELIFHRLNGWRALPRKTTAEGRAARMALLRNAGLPDPAPLLGRYRRAEVQPDDVLDAAACSLTAARRLAGTACRVPDPADGPPPCDARGLAMAIWY